MDLLKIIVRLQEKRESSGYRSLTANETVVLDVADLEAEVNNGGLHQFFFNSAGDRVLAMIEALKAIGATETADVIVQACNLFDREPSADRNARQVQLERVDEETFEPLDERFYAESARLEELLMAYCRAHQVLR